MLILYLCVRGIDVASCIFVWGVSVLIIHLCVMGIDVEHVCLC
jgi:hypothetical protein